MEKVALFGYNNIAQKHLKGLQSILPQNDMVQQVIVAGRNIEKAREMTREYGNLTIYSDWRELLVKEKPKLVVVATPNFLHKEMTIGALQSGAHVLCEKPLGVSSAEVAEMYQVAKENKRLLIPAMSSRYSENALGLRKKLAALSDLRLESGEAKYLRARHIPGSVGFIKKDQAGGGVLLDLGVHVLDLALWFWNDEVSAVKGWMKTDLSELEEEVRLANDYGEELDLGQMDVEYEAGAELAFKNGGSLTLHVAWASLHPDALRGERADEIAPFVRLSAVGDRSFEWSLKGEPLQARYGRQIEHVVKVIGGQEEPMVCEEEIIRLHRVIDAIYISAAQKGRLVKI